MNFILNECSLHGQFESVEAFLKSLEANLKCFRLVRSQSDGEIRKIADFYKCKITKDQRLGDLKQFPKSEELLRLMIALDKEMRTEPYWDLSAAHDYGTAYWLDGEDVAATAVAEAAERNEGLLSFDSKRYSDCQLVVKKGEKEHRVISVYRPAYLAHVSGILFNPPHFPSHDIRGIRRFRKLYGLREAEVLTAAKPCCPVRPILQPV